MLSPIIQRALVAIFGTLTTSGFVDPPLLPFPLVLCKYLHYRLLAGVYNYSDPIYQAISEKFRITLCSVLNAPDFSKFQFLKNTFVISTGTRYPEFFDA